VAVRLEAAAGSTSTSKPPVTVSSSGIRPLTTRSTGNFPEAIWLVILGHSWTG
jgi:hypothetical protein